MSSLRNRKEDTGTTMSFGGVPLGAPSDAPAKRSSTAASSTPAPWGSVQSTQADLENGGVDPLLDPTAALRDLKLPVRQIDLASGVQLSTLLNRQVTVEQRKYGTWLGFGRLFVGGFYLVAAVAFLFVCIFKPTPAYPMFWDPLRYNSMSKTWNVALERMGPGIRIDWSITAMFLVFGLYELSYFLPFVRDLYLGFVFFYQMNPYRWLVHGVAGGLLMSFFAVVMGVTSVPVFVLLMTVIIAAAASALFSELVNRPKLYFTNDSDTVDSLVKQYSLRADRATEAINNKYFIQAAVVNAWPIIAAVVLLLVYAGVVSAYFWVTVADSVSHVAWFAFVAYATGAFVLVALVVLTVARLLVSWEIFQNYFWYDVLLIGVEIVMILGSILILSGQAAMA